MIGFAPFNRPVAKIFLGDVGSLPIGLLLGWCLLQILYRHHLAAAFLLPLYYLADATVTLLWRLARRKRSGLRIARIFISERPQRPHGISRSERGFRAQCRPCGISDRIDHDPFVGDKHCFCCRWKHCRCFCTAPVFTAAIAVSRDCIRISSRGRLDCRN